MNFFHSGKPAAVCSGVIAAGLVGLLISIAVLSGVPPVDRDSLTHHLAVSKLYLRQGGMHEIPEVPFSYYPMNVEALYLIPLYFGNDILPKYLHFGFALLTGWLIFAYLRNRLRSLPYGLLGALLFLSLPVTVKLSTTAYVDLGLICFSAAALFQLFRWTQTGFRTRHLIAAGVLTGLCLGTKYNGLLVVLLLTLCVPVLRQRTNDMLASAGSSQADRRLSPMGMVPLGNAILFAVIALALFSPWMIRNYLWTGNPLHPLAQDVWHTNRAADAETWGAAGAAEESEDNRLSNVSGSGLNHFSVRKLVFGESLAEILLIPVRIFFQGEDDNPQYFDGRLNPYLLLFPLCTLFRLRRSKASRVHMVQDRVMGAFALLYLLLAFFLTDMRIRYVGPIIPPLVVLTVIGLKNGIDFFRSRASLLISAWAPGMLVLLLVGLLGMNASYLVKQFQVVEPLSYLGGRLSRDQYIQKYRPEHAAISFANRQLPEDARILSLFNGNRTYYSDRQMICDTQFFHSAVLASKSAADLVQRFKQAGISHLLVRLDLFKQWSGSQFNAAEASLLQSFFQERLQCLYRGYGYALFAIKAG